MFSAWGGVGAPDGFDDGSEGGAGDAKESKVKIESLLFVMYFDQHLNALLNGHIARLAKFALCKTMSPILGAHCYIDS
jgi:hypothetical protein